MLRQSWSCEGAHLRPFSSVRVFNDRLTELMSYSDQSEVHSIKKSSVGMKMLIRMSLSREDAADVILSFRGSSAVTCMNFIVEVG